MYFDEPRPWYRDGRIWLIVFVVAVLVYGYLTGQVVLPRE